MKFSQRIGKIESVKQLQIESIDSDLRNGLWNGMKLCVLDKLSKYDRNASFRGTEYHALCILLWHELYKEPIDTIPNNGIASEMRIRNAFYSKQWYDVYDHLEFIANISSPSLTIDNIAFIAFCNEVLKREFSGYRFIDGKISPITNEIEIEEIESAINQSGHYTPLKGANIHLKQALEKLSDKIAPDYRNSIKESISAVESVAKVISESSRDTLGSALDKIKGKIKLHPALERGYKQLYGYTSDGDGIRHALVDDPSCDFEDAKYMLVSCSAFVNYLIIKAGKNGLNVE